MAHNHYPLHVQSYVVCARTHIHTSVGTKYGQYQLSNYFFLFFFHFNRLSTASLSYKFAFSDVIKSKKKILSCCADIRFRQFLFFVQRVDVDFVFFFFYVSSPFLYLIRCHICTAAIHVECECDRAASTLHESTVRCAVRDVHESV